MSSAWIKSKFGRAGGAASPSPTRSKLKTTAVRAILQSRGTCHHQYLGRVWKLKGIREGFRLQGDRLLVGRIILVSGEIFFIFMIMNKKKTANIAQISRKSEICALFAFF